MRALRRRALERCLARIRFEQKASRFQGLSPVNGILNTMALFANDPERSELVPSLAGVETLALGRRRGTVSALPARARHPGTPRFAMLAVLAGPARNMIAGPRVPMRFSDAAQEMDELDGVASAKRRDPIRGGWCFSDGRHRWPVSDCTAEALSALLAADDARQGRDSLQPVSPDRL